jgi:hypothetical protein
MKSATRRILHDEGIMEIPHYAMTDNELWTAKIVREAVAEAFAVLFDSSGRVGPRDVRAAWPEYILEGQEYWEQWKIGTQYVGKRVRTQRKAHEVAKMEAVLIGNKKGKPWLWRYLADHNTERTRLSAWAIAKCRGVSSRELCRRQKWAYSTFMRYRDTGAGIIAMGLNRDDVEIW